MKVHFWGVRGSIPSPLMASDIQAKINAVVQRITPEDLKSFDTREKFIADLPDWLYGTVGGNSPCISITTDSGKRLILDAGSGIRVLGKSTKVPADNHYSIFFSHFHWDHICGFPFFDHAFNPNLNIDIYSAEPEASELLAIQMPSLKLFPVLWENFSRNFKFHTVEPAVEYDIDGLKVMCCKMSHPGSSYSFSFKEGDRKFVYATDVELMDLQSCNEQHVDAVFRDADVVVLDTQYTMEEAQAKEKWGHSAFCYAIDFAVSKNIKKVYLFHHEPTYDDKKIDSILNAAKWYSSFITHDSVEVELAVEGHEVEI
ncbi:MAG: MBL fold metallo-hydrolase [Treponema sp.]|uniref:MBL fold metallo-hydrolase n=1 Tax=Treponema sp. TaxID=166 RepID=UPI00298DB6C1|nr:MBL fold metallo-hydrolase [Treponema sp.]MBR5934413.1 MBL fold metallo-hydrolase [Treponema sp.]